ncbi:glycosyltransferase [Enterococcus faecium]|uniref:glycosyltransferase n=2 Tax=Enterococcus faecium TaxID=1352 RepID=UPI0002A3E35C|nr:glycosyltransferase [Enterococcus faecium]MBC9721931.1 glycosyltransferase [Lactobacillus sp.]EGP5298739.1 glycosyltransferase [Enterococcus faecium]ELA91635.1 hypothetical protein OI5_03260 [Enterococcus faecium EnGen0009]EME8183661.1 glycosyltransferase [Enterococcus faecium]MCL4607590.1 glycosyltransferase [Enterococcus faecium]
MKILMINSVCGVGSTGRICTDLYEELSKEGHECCIAYGRGDASEEINTYKIGNKFDNYWHVLETRLFDNHGFASRRATKKFISFIIMYKPDIIHLHNIHGYYLNVQILFNFLKKSKIPIVWTFHDSWAFSGHAAYIEYDKNGTLPNKNSNFAERYAYPKSFINRSYYNFERKKRLFSNVDNLTIVTPSNWLNKMVKMSFLKDYQVITINNGINLEKFEKTEQKTGIKKGNKKEVLAVANIWEKRKGLEDIIYFAEKLDERKYHFIIVGKVGRTLPANISHIDRTDNLEQLIQLYQQADVFINPTYQDNFPTTNIEALAAGTPVITYNTGGSGEILTEDVGFVIEQGNREKFIEKISEIRKDINISNYCMQTAQIYSVKNMNRKYILIYEKTKNGSC